MSFDDVIISLFVTGVNVNTLPLKVYTSLKTGITPEINALCTLMLAFTVLAVAASALISRKKKAEGLLHGMGHVCPCFPSYLRAQRAKQQN